MAVGQGDLHPHFGAGIFGEISAVPNWLEIELAIKALATADGALIPIDVLFKIPFHLTNTIHPFIGLGPTLVIVAAGDIAVHFGLAVAVGAGARFL